MAILTATATEMKNNFGKYLKYVMDGGEVIITKNGYEVGRLISRENAVSYLTDSLRGILKPVDIDEEDARDAVLREKYEITD